MAARFKIIELLQLLKTDNIIGRHAIELPKPKESAEVKPVDVPKQKISYFQSKLAHAEGGDLSAVT